MKKLYILCAFCIAATVATAQTRPVIFAVDLTTFTTRALTTTDSILVGGDFSSPAWQPKMNKLTRQGAATSKIYARTYALAAGSIQYKFVINDWDPTGFNEFSGGATATCVTGGNRSATIAAGTTPVRLYFKYGSCDSLPINAVRVQDLREEVKVAIAPNPVSDVTYFTFNNPSNASYSLILSNATGQTVRTYADVTGEVVTIERGDLPAGLYFATLRSADGRLLTEKIVVE
ncbi:MAG: Secretion system C-terminal sorting domain [Bacteroidota bacterium]